MLDRCKGGAATDGDHGVLRGNSGGNPSCRGPASLPYVVSFEEGFDPTIVRKVVNIFGV